MLEKAGEPHPLEIKSGATVNADFFKGLRYWHSLAGEGEATLVYGGAASYTRQGMKVLSWRDWPDAVEEWRPEKDSNLRPAP